MKPLVKHIALISVNKSTIVYFYGLSVWLPPHPLYFFSLHLHLAVASTTELSSLFFSFLLTNCIGVIYLNTLKFTCNYVCEIVEMVSVVLLCFSQVKVVELKVTWITKSYSPKGSDSVYPPPSTITQENLCRSALFSSHMYSPHFTNVCLFLTI